jgi:flagellar basal-body rod protein FlgB
MFDRLWLSTSIPAVSEVLRFAELRHKYLANNVANVDTPGFKALDLPEADFREALQRAIEAKRRGGPLGATLGESERLLLGSGSLDIEPVYSGSDPRVDGNDVSLDLELSKLSKNSMEYQILTRLLARRLAFLRQAVRERVSP